VLHKQCSVSAAARPQPAVAPPAMRRAPPPEPLPPVPPSPPPQPSLPLPASRAAAPPARRCPAPARHGLRRAGRRRAMSGAVSGWMCSCGLAGAGRLRARRRRAERRRINRPAPRALRWAGQLSALAFNGIQLEFNGTPSVAGGVVCSETSIFLYLTILPLPTYHFHLQPPLPYYCITHYYSP
jgi:hypothetical protein